eukprot:gene38417-61914_t
MVTLPQEFLALCRQLGDAQQRCSAAMQAQARQIEALTAEVVRLRDDVATESNDRELNQRSAPAVEDGLSALHDLGVADLARALAEKQVSSVEVTGHLLNRIT